MPEQSIRELFGRLQKLDTPQLMAVLRQLQKDEPETFKRLLDYMRHKEWTDEGKQSPER